MNSAQPPENKPKWLWWHVVLVGVLAVMMAGVALWLAWFFLYIGTLAVTGARDSVG